MARRRRTAPSNALPKCTAASACIRLILSKEIDGFVADRLMEALWREALWLVNDGVATAAEIDDAMRFGPGLRWSFMGTFMIYRIAGGEAGMRHFMAQFGPALKWPWTKLMDVPELTDELLDRICDQSDAQVDEQTPGLSIRELEALRDDCLVEVMQGLRNRGFGAGQTLAEFEHTLFERGNTLHPDVDVTQPIRVHERVVPNGWVDYNGHTNDSNYMQLSSEAGDKFSWLIGVDEAYLKSGLLVLHRREPPQFHRPESRRRRVVRHRPVDRPRRQAVPAVHQHPPRRRRFGRGDLGAHDAARRHSSRQGFSCIARVAGETGRDRRAPQQAASTGAGRAGRRPTAHLNECLAPTRACGKHSFS